MIQASADDTHSPLVAEALALQLAAKVARVLQLQRVSFLTDNLSLAKMAASRNLSSNNTLWRCRTLISSFLQDTHPQHHVVYHIHRNINGIAHNAAHQVLNSRLEPAIGCTHSSHSNSPCHTMLQIQNLQIEGFVIQVVLCI